MKEHKIKTWTPSEAEAEFIMIEIEHERYLDEKHNNREVIDDE
jgi:hypothetical protein